jgi:hypothetical protein
VTKPFMDGPGLNAGALLPSLFGVRKYFLPLGGWNLFQG